MPSATFLLDPETKAQRLVQLSFRRADGTLEPGTGHVQTIEHDPAKGQWTYFPVDNIKLTQWQYSGYHARRHRDILDAHGLPRAPKAPPSREGCVPLSVHSLTVAHLTAYSI